MKMTTFSSYAAAVVAAHDLGSNPDAIYTAVCLDPAAFMAGEPARWIVSLRDVDTDEDLGTL
jgi:hypothetical protein